MKHQLDALTTTRGVAALLVVVFHFGCTVFPFNQAEHFFRSSNLAVGYFFVLSGFVMYYTYHNRRNSFRPFMEKRLVRIVPAFYIALAMSAVLIIAEGIGSGPMFLKQMALNLTFTQAFFPGYALTINSPGWSLSIEMFFYILFPALIAFANRESRRFLWFVATFFVLSQVTHLAMVAKYKPEWGTAFHEFVYYFPLFHFNQFFVGMVGGYLFFQYKKRGIKYASVWPLVAIVLLVNFMPRSVSLHNGLLAPLYMLLVLAVALHNSSWLRWRPLVFLGEVSYGIYIFQEPVHRYAVNLNGRYLQLSEPVFFYTYTIALVGVAALCYHLVEKPIRNMLNRP
ncbi:acyltransferase family protein [Polluticoccus soli]|uniref:acyltransferase family protein n=1 Tax=Polluticoccus soli TaxID=3034150 RepID=UPI0023E1BF50|nr:acyltransferase [Flavipsychrobacter sp. JY13-12]